MAGLVIFRIKASKSKVTLYFFVLLCHSKPPFEEVLAKLSKAKKGKSFSHTVPNLYLLSKNSTLGNLQRRKVKKSYQIVISNSAQTVLKMPFSTNDTNYTDQKALPDQIFKILSKPFQKCHFLQFPVLKIAFFQLCIV